MTSKTNAKPQRNAKPVGEPAPSASNSYAPSVPISLYREVANELQSVKLTMESLKLQNQQLSDHNQQLRIEIERVVQSALQLRQVADSRQQAAPSTASSPLPELEIHFEAPPASAPKPEPSILLEEVDEPLGSAVTPKKQFTEQESRPRPNSQTERSSEVGGWWLMFVICLIVVTAFGTGFLVVRPLLPQR